VGYSHHRRRSPVRLRDAALRRLRAANVLLAVAAVVLVVGFAALSAGATTAKQHAKARLVAQASATPTAEPRAPVHHHRRRHHHHHHHAAAAPAATATPTSAATAAPTAVATPVPTPVPTAQAPVAVSGGS
jgi:ABC-type nickel/cobalt efflux system permease component RcnA